MSSSLIPIPHADSIPSSSSSFSSNSLIIDGDKLLQTLSDHFLLLNNQTNNHTNGTLPSIQHSMDAFFFVSLAFTLVIGTILSILILRYYTKSNPFPWFLYIPLLITYLLLFTAVSLVCIDLASAISSDKLNKKQLADPALVVLWRFIYWSLQILSWILLPVFQSYLYTGEFLAIFRWLRAILDNIITYAVMLLVGGIALGGFCLYIAISNLQDPDHSQTISLDLIAGLGLSLSNIYGLVLLVGFIGYGLVGLPRSILDMSNDERQLRLYEFKTPTIVEELEDLEDELLEYLSICKVLDRRVTQDHKQRKNIDRIMKTVQEATDHHPQLLKKSGSFIHLEHSENLIPSKIEELTRSQCVKIHRLLQKAIREFSSKQYQWKHLQRKAFILQDIIESKSNHKEKRIVSVFRSPRPKFLQTILEKPEWIYRTYLRSFVLKLIVTLFIPFGLILMWCEFTPLFKNIHATKHLKLSILELIIMSMKDRFAIQFVSLGILSLILAVLLFAMYRVRILYIFQMVPHHTDAYTLFYTCIFLCRAIPSMCFNFLQMVGVDPDDGVAYYTIYGALRLDGLRIFGVLGGFIVDYFPILIIVVAFITLFKLIERCGTLCNIQRFNYSTSTMNDETVLEGREILQRARKRKMRQLQHVAVEKISSSFDKLEEIYLSPPPPTTITTTMESISSRDVDSKQQPSMLHEENEEASMMDDPLPHEEAENFEMRQDLLEESVHKRLDQIYEKYGRERHYGGNTTTTTTTSNTLIDSVKTKLKNFKKKNFDSVL
ncbi:hypothetical protein FDP41_005217 [Naegleria fowleri]|uniref:Uncharacterized protein n=1 Tax=Naegleria fowleri TaxID=5763 RepID=A0A6A5BPN6_NAEFO|nr:uncharacterized protein FDP41_005217 [Naegleria fowleri]KAF0975890.1 hypothetical protein FDP41_005217 [Naegleria fowleri]